MSIRADIQTLQPGTLVELFELDTSALTGGGVDRFHAGVNELGDDVIWQGNTYTRFPFVASGFEKSGNGQLPRPKIQVANVTGLIGALAREFDDLAGAKLTRKRTFLKYLDAANFAAGNPSADPNAHFDDEIWFIDRKASENAIYVEWELSAAFDVAGIMLPRRQAIQNVCTWKYRSAECGYAGGAVADINDNATANLAQDQCGKRLASCALRFGTAPLPFGGFPGVGLMR